MQLYTVTSFGCTDVPNSAQIDAQTYGVDPQFPAPDNDGNVTATGKPFQLDVVTELPFC